MSGRHDDDRLRNATGMLRKAYRVVTELAEVQTDNARRILKFIGPMLP